MQKGEIAPSEISPDPFLIRISDDAIDLRIS